MSSYYEEVKEAWSAGLSLKQRRLKKEALGIIRRNNIQNKASMISRCKEFKSNIEKNIEEYKDSPQILAAHIKHREEIIQILEILEYLTGANITVEINEKWHPLTMSDEWKLKEYLFSDIIGPTNITKAGELRELLEHDLTDKTVPDNKKRDIRRIIEILSKKKIL